MEMADRNGQPKGVRRNHTPRHSPGALPLRPPVPILKTHDVALVEAAAGLHLDDLARDHPGLGQAVGLADRDVGGLVLGEQDGLIAEGG
jgi:hypothetical protein